MARPIPTLERRVAEEAVRRGLVAAVVMEAAAREWADADGGDSFPVHLVKRSLLTEEQRAELDALVAAEAEPPADAGGGGGEATPAPARPSHPSEVIRGYRILERLGRGGMGSVYRAEQLGMNRIVALKILRRPLGLEEQHVERLRREARLVGALDHPNIVRGLDVGQHGPYHYFTMEFVDGETLRDLLRRRGALPEAEALRIIEHLCHALDHAHSRAVVHRDVKPGNIILTPDGTPKLTDYGLAKGPSDFSLTQSGVTIGTPQYLSPEQARDPIHVDIQTDIYSLGATAYHLLAGIPPHASETLAGLLTKVLYEKPRTARQVNPRVSPGASFLVEKMMAKQKRHRYRTPRDLLHDLRALAAGKSIVPRNWEGDFEVHEVRRRYRVGFGIAAVVAVLAVASTVFLQYRVREEERRNREEAAESAFREIREHPRPRDRAGWEAKRDAWEDLLRGPHAATGIRSAAEFERSKCQDFIDAWDEALGILGQAQALARENGNWRAAAVLLEGSLEGLRERGAPGSDPERELREKADLFWSQGERAGDLFVEDRLARIDALGGVADAAKIVEDRLLECRGQLLDRYVKSVYQAPVQRLDEVLAHLSQVRATIEESYFSRGVHEQVDRALKEAAFGEADGILASAEDRIVKDGFLQGLLREIPAPAARDLESRVVRERERLRGLNLEWIQEALARVREAESRGAWAEAIAMVEDAKARSLPDLRPPLAAAASALEEKRLLADAAVRKAVDGIFTAVLGEMERRDFRAASRRLDESVVDTAPLGGDHRVAEALVSVRQLLEMVDEVAFGPVLRGRLQGGDLPLGLQFEEGTRQPHPTVSGVRVKDSDTGPVVVFDAPNQPDLQGALYRLSLPLVMVYSGLSGTGLTHEQALVQGALVVLDGEVNPEREIRAAMSALQVAGEGLPALRPAIRALLARAEDTISTKARKRDDFERLASDTLEATVAALKDGDPVEALRLLDLLLSRSLSTTRFAQEKRNFLLDLRKQAESMRDNQGLAAFFKGARVSVGEKGPNRDSITRIEWAFLDESELKGFVPPEDGAPLYRVFPEAPGPDGVPLGSRLVFLEPEPGADPAPDGARRRLFDSPLVLECPFNPARYVAVSFTYRSEAPLYTQVSVMGNHVGVLTDDGRREGGRGVHAWQKEDWRNADQEFPSEYRHDYVAGVADPAKFRENRGQRYFQFDPGVEYRVKVEWDQGHLRFFVNNQEIWDASLRERNFRDNPPRIRIVTYTPCWIDDLTVEGVVDRNYWNNYWKKRGR